MQSLLNILKVNEPRTGVKDGREWKMQDCECILVNEDGTFGNVGVLMLPKHLTGDAAPKVGVYAGSFALMVAQKDRRIMAQLTALIPIPPARSAVVSPVAAKAV